MGGSKSNLYVILFAFIGMFCWGITPLFAKLGLKEVDPKISLAIRTATTTIVLTGWIISDGSLVKISQVSTISLLFLIAEAIVATFIGDLAYFIAIKHGQVSLVAIILSCAPLVTILFSMLFLKEAVTITQIIGSLLIIGGIIIALK
jgi:transporter family protein